MSTVAEETNQAPTIRQNLLQGRVALLIPSIHYWRGMYQLTTSAGYIDVRVSGDVLNERDVTAPRAKLLDATTPCDADGTPWLHRFRLIDNSYKRLIGRFSVPLGGAGVRIVPLRAVTEFLEHLEGVRESMRTMVQEFCDTLPDVLQQIRAAKPATLWSAVCTRIPDTPAAMRRKFYIECTPFELGGTGAPSEVSMADLAESSNLLRESIQRKIEEAIEAMISTPRMELAQALVSLSDLIGRDGRVTAKSYQPVYAAIEKLRLFTFAADDELLRIIASLERRLDNTVPATLTSDAEIGASFRNTLAAVVNEITDAAKLARDQAAFGGGTRYLDV